MQPQTVINPSEHDRLRRENERLTKELARLREWQSEPRLTKSRRPSHPLESVLDHSEGELRRHRDQLQELVSERTVQLHIQNARLTEQVSERKHAEEALRRVHEMLEQTVSERTAELRAANVALSENGASFRALGDNLPDGAIYQFVRSTDGTGRFRYLSEGIEHLCGISASRVMADPDILDRIVQPEDLISKRVAEEESARRLTVFDIEARIFTPAGETKWMLWRSAPRRLDNGDTLWDGIVTDVTKRKAAEEALQRANRTLRVLKHCDEALVRASSESELLNRVCQVIVEIGGAKMAWVGYAEHDPDKSVRPVAVVGGEEESIKAARISWGETLRGRGPTGSSIRTCEVHISHDIASDRRLTPWRKKQLQLGYAALIALPLVWENRCFGALSIYSGQVNGFNDEEVGLLKQLAGDLTYGIIALRTRAEREQLQGEILRISEREKQVIAQELHDGLCQHLAGTAFMGSLLHRRLAERGDNEADQARQICDLLNTGVDEARNLSHGLHPVKPEGEGLMEALAQLAQTVTKLFHIRCLFRCDESVVVDNQVSATHLFRIAQEAVNNAMKHGQATQVLISLQNDSRGVTLSIRDNGVGIPRSLTASRGMGMQIMNHRASAIGANLRVRRAGKRGTEVTCTLALHQKGGISLES